MIVASEAKIISDSARKAKRESKLNELRPKFELLMERIIEIAENGDCCLYDWHIVNESLRDAEWFFRELGYNFFSYPYNNGPKRSTGYTEIRIDW